MEEATNDNGKTPLLMTGLMVAVNTGLFFWMLLFGEVGEEAYMIAHGAMVTDLVAYGGAWWRLLTAVFLHWSLEHLLNNMLVLAAVGSYIERNMGAARFLVLYVLAGIGGNLVSLYMALWTGDYAVSAGASGAVFGLIGALFAVALKNGGRVEGLSWRRVLILIVVALAAGFLSDGVDNVAHVGGLVCGFLCGLPLARRAEASV